MPYVGASNTSQSSFQSLKEKHFTRNSSSDVLHEQSSPSPPSSSPLSSCLPSDHAQDVVALSEHLSGFQLPQPPPIRENRSLSITSSRSTATDVDVSQLLPLPNESTHVYSYNPLSPNSLAVRLKILKRSLEIMVGNPDMLREPEEGSVRHEKKPSEQPENSKNIANLSKWNAHSAALQAFVSNSATSNGVQSPLKTSGRASHLKRASSLAFLPKRSENNDMPLAGLRRVSVGNSLNTVGNDMFPNGSLTGMQSAESINGQMSDLEKLLDLLNETLENNTSARASDLHMISLFNINKLALGKNSSSGSENLRRILLDSLAEPFFEHSNSDDENEMDNDEELQKEVQDFINSDESISFGSLRPQQDYGRILHTFTSTRNSAPHAIFTCTQDYPFQFRAANDLACLIFGISNNVIRALTLLDLLHKDSRDFVLHKILSTEDQELAFTGEIVAIVQPGAANKSSKLIWASIWAKRKNGLLVCVFEKVPCEYMDVKLSITDYSVSNVEGDDGLLNYPLEVSSLSSNGRPKLKKIFIDDSSFVINEDDEEGVPYTATGTASKNKSIRSLNQQKDISAISRSLGDLIHNVQEGTLVNENDDLMTMPERVSAHINKERYFTLNHLSYNIPCAVSSTILENELKLKIHSLPYQAGLFIVDSHTYELISFNRSISKNMFGHHFGELVGKSIGEIIPSFADIMSFIDVRYSALSVSNRQNKGLVLTEHFFRKIQAEMSGNKNQFYTSVGIDALHKDGDVIKVDFQLRVVNQSIMFLWITYSRDVLFKDYTTPPSQLQMLKDHEPVMIGSGSSSVTSSKQSSSKLSLESLKPLSQLSVSGATVGKIKPGYISNSRLSEGTVTDLKGRKPPKGNCGNDENQEDNGPTLNDSDLKERLELAQIYVKDKSQFVREENFKLDKDMIISMTSSPPYTDLGLSDDALSQPEIKQDASTTGLQATFLHTPEVNIGARKRIKKFDDFIVLQKMGEGAYGKVDLCLHKEKKYVVVIKMIFKERILVDTWVRDRKLGTVPSEIQIMATLNKNPHDNILRLLDFFEDDEYYYIETPVHGETGCIDLFDLIEFKTNMTEFEAKLIFKQVASAVKHLHDQGIVHRDIKDENVIVDSKGFVKLIDFGSAAYVKNGPFDVFVGTIDYAAPEVLEGEPYEGKPQDIWALGILLYTIVFKENPFYNIDEILEGTLQFENEENVSEECVDLVSKILTRQVSKRLTINDIYKHKWLEV